MSRPDLTDRDKDLCTGWVSGHRGTDLAEQFAFANGAAVAARFTALRQQGWVIPRRRPGRATGMAAWAETHTWQSPDGDRGGDVSPVIP